MSMQIRNVESKDYIEKSRWMTSLKVGDTVCDCRFKHLKIATIEEHRVVRFPRWLRNFVFADWMPYSISNLLDDVFHWVSYKLGNVELIDKTVLLEDGAHCSVMNCCDPVTNHSEH